MSRSGRIFRVVYTSIYFLLCIILLGLLLITPADAIERSIRNRQNYNIWILIICYVVTILLVAFIYFLRLYVNKTVLAAIPKKWMPIELGDVNKAVHRLIKAGLDRSAAIAYEARPRVERDPAGGARGEHNVTPPAAEGLGISASLQDALWKNIEHKGWASPRSADLPNLQYTTVLSELPNLVEAKAMTLAPPDPTSTAQLQPAPLDPEAVSLLQRPANLSLRGYIDHLADLGVLVVDESTSGFLQRYEYARFSTRPISNAAFRELMHLFAEVLRSMQPLDLALLDAETDQSSVSHFGQDGHDDASSHHPSTPRSHNLSRSGTASTLDSVRRQPQSQSQPQQLQPQVQAPPRSSSWGNYRTAPNTPRSRRVMSRRSSNSSISNNSFAQSRHPYQPGDGGSSSGSLRSGGSSSVIRLATHEDDDERLPYVLNLRGTADTFAGST